MDTKGLQNEFIKWCKDNNHNPKSEDETKKLFVSFMKEKHPKEYQAAMANQLKQQQAQAKKAAHGTKLTYFKSLKNQCAEDEEVTYFKKGGSVRCGCKKKEEGGEIAKAQKGTAVLKFKNDYNSRKVKDSEKDYLEGRGDHKVNNNLSAQQKFKNDYSSKRVKDSEEDYLKGTADHEINKKEYKPLKQLVPTKKQQTTGTVKKIEYKKLDNKFPEKKACGSKLKKHLLGGSLNGIPFYQGGTSKGGLPTAPKAKDRYANSIRLYASDPRFKYDIRYLDGQTTGVVLDTPYTTIPASITLQVVGNDTIYRETPDQKRFSLRGFPVIRTATNTDSNRQEFETMRRRFNTAWNLAKQNK